MKLISDFDGVWTFPEDEARAQGEVLERALVSWLPQEEEARASAWLRDARAAALREPTTYGWAPGGRLSAFGDEDPFANHSALLHYMHLQAEGGDPMATAMREAISSNGHKSLDAFGGWTHAEGVRRVAESRGPGILPESAEAGLQMLAGGVEVVVVSNSGTDKLVHWFDHAGVANTVHPDLRPGALRLRGSARKFILDPDSSDVLQLGSITIEVARPSYAAILEDERPAAVVGDVLSLDLALPLAMKRRDPRFGDMHLYWMIQPYTPEWMRELVDREAGDEIEPITGGLAELADRLMQHVPRGHA